jgi:hypothetical protein
VKALDPWQLAYEIADSLTAQMSPLKALGLLPDRDALAGVFFPIAKQQAAMGKEVRRLRKQARQIEASVARARRPTGPRLVGLSDADWAQVRSMMTCVNVPEAS